MKILNKSFFKKLIYDYKGIRINTRALIRFSKFHFCEKISKHDGEIEEDANFNFFHDQSTYIKSVIVEMKCKGCGVNLQSERPDKIGFIPEVKVKDFIEKDGSSDNTPQDGKNEDESSKDKTQLKEFEKITDYK
jgi:hypothetical protein